MNPLPPPFGEGGIVFWRIDPIAHADTWNSGEGAFQFGGRWNSKGVRAVYAALDPATAILEVAVHKTFRVLDTARHVLSAAPLIDPRRCHVLSMADVPNVNWLSTGIPSAGQQVFGDMLLAEHAMMLVPSVVSPHSWNVVFDPVGAAGRYGSAKQEVFALDTRLHPPLFRI